MRVHAIAIIQARMSSTRLPGKVMMSLAGKPVIWHIYMRSELCRLVEKTYVATSTDPTDDPLAEFCINNNMNLFRGSLSNVMSRYLEILDREEFPYYVRITGDCPLIHPEFIDNQILALKQYDGDAIWCSQNSSVLEGQGVFSVRSLRQIAAHSRSAGDREHVGSIYLTENPEKFRIVELGLPGHLIAENFRLTLDEPKDYELLNRIYDNLWASEPLKLTDVLSWLSLHPEIAGINSGVHHRKTNTALKQKKERWSDVPKAGRLEYKTDIK